MATTSYRQRHQLGRRIVKAREAMGWNQKQLADAAGVNGGYLSSVERGLKEPSIATLHKLRDALVLDDEVFLAWIDLLKPSAEDAA